MARGETYEEFVGKFQPKLTTDDCYTPPEVYEAVADYVSRRFGVRREDCAFVRKLDANPRGIFGGGLLLSERAAAERAAAERWLLSGREVAIVRSLGGGAR